MGAGALHGCVTRGVGCVACVYVRTVRDIAAWWNMLSGMGSRMGLVRLTGALCRFVYPRRNADSAATRQFRINLVQRLSGTLVSSLPTDSP